MLALYQLLLNVADAGEAIVPASAEPIFIGGAHSQLWQEAYSSLLRNVTELIGHAAELGDRLLVSLHQITRNSALVRQKRGHDVSAGIVELNPLTAAYPLALAPLKGSAPTRETYGAVLRPCSAAHYQPFRTGSGQEQIANNAGGLENPRTASGMKNRNGNKSL